MIYLLVNFINSKPALSGLDKYLPLDHHPSYSTVVQRWSESHNNISIKSNVFLKFPLQSKMVFNCLRALAGQAAVIKRSSHSCWNNQSVVEHYTIYYGVSCWADPSHRRDKKLWFCLQFQLVPCQYITDVTTNALEQLCIEFNDLTKPWTSGFIIIHWKIAGK